MELAAGTMITPSLRLVRELGRGAMGSVWVADHLMLDTQMAVKLLLHEAMQQHGSIMHERFVREAKATAQLHSPHVVRIFDRGVTAGQVPFIVMELLAGESLGQYLLRKQRLNVAQLLHVVQQVALALDEAHTLNIVHRDIKPDNIFLATVPGSAEPLVKVLDFGIAKLLDAAAPNAQLTSTGAIIGTPKYMSPEQMLSAKAVDLQADLWALAVVAYRALCGVFPFRGESLTELCMAVANAQYSAPSQVEQTLPPGLDQWFSRAFARQARKRFTSAGEMAQAYRAALAPICTPAYGGGD